MDRSFLSQSTLNGMWRTDVKRTADLFGDDAAAGDADAAASETQPSTTAWVVLLVVGKLVSLILKSPRLVAAFSRRRKQEKGWQALSRGLLAIGAGDGARARAARDEAARFLPHEPLTHLLAAQSAQFFRAAPPPR